MFMLVKAWILLCFLTAAAWIDVKKQIVPNRLVLWAVLVRGFLWLAESAFEQKLLIFPIIRDLFHCAAAVLALLLLVWISRSAFGMGDVKLLGVIALYLGALWAYISFFYGLLLAAAVSVWLLARRKKGRRGRIPFVPFLLAGYCLAFVL